LAEVENSLVAESVAMGVLVLSRSLARAARIGWRLVDGWADVEVAYGEVVEWIDWWVAAPHLARLG
jgi:hypothetical protein